eukprot:GHVP01002619.1.p1 GENE.GHVP01002619.1~~GHVP01002619.1.p1  ORF type:complete len:154 (+),score=26.53 GHVP01002619.1:48-464(+)
METNNPVFLFPEEFLSEDHKIEYSFQAKEKETYYVCDFPMQSRIRQIIEFSSLSGASRKFYMKDPEHTCVFYRMTDSADSLQKLSELPIQDPVEISADSPQKFRKLSELDIVKSLGELGTLEFSDFEKNFDFENSQPE